ncbi:MAG TPA: hypothetical protein EYG10_03710 [Gammaproteobacteria bacterium]|jgi:hypothetical protein|nr:hypothetical protein [Gammaproteobacteria bacterium]
MLHLLNMKPAFSLLTLLLLATVSCTSSKTIQYENVPIQRAQIELTEEQLLDVGILIFDPNLPEEDQEFIFPEIRKAEARYIPYHLKTTLEDTGFWGGVWVLPEKSEAMDLIVGGRIEVSNGLKVAVRIGVWDITGREWMNKVYETTVSRSAYSQQRDYSQDPYQSFYNKIANDLLKIRNSLSSPELRRISEIGDLRFAAELVPGVYSDYLMQDEKDIFSAKRLPSENDEMMGRIQNVKEREFVLVDTLNEYYAKLYQDISVPYENWRKLSREEMLTYEDLKRSALKRQLLGAAAILGAIAYEGNSQTSSYAKQAALYGGIEVIKSGFGMSAEAKVHKESLKELGTSFDTQAKPLIIEIEGQTLRLTGTAKEKFLEWRKLLKQIYTEETGFNISENSDPQG